MKRGEIYWLDLPDQEGYEQTGMRPCVIVMSNSLIGIANLVVVVPFTSSQPEKYRRLPTAVTVSSGEGGLAADSVALGHQVRAVDIKRLTERIGTLPTKYLLEIEDILRDILDL